MKSEMILTIVGVIFASTGFWTVINTIITNKSKKANAEGMMLRGMAHDRICYLGMQYINKGSITQDEYDNLYNDLYKPYLDLEGNGVAKKIMAEVDKLPIQKSKEE